MPGDVTESSRINSKKIEGELENCILGFPWWSTGYMYFQDGGEEGHALIFCCNTKIATGCWTSIDRRMLEPTKKRFPMSKDKGEMAMWQ